MDELRSKKWPKTIPSITKEQKIIKEKFMLYWHEVLPRRYPIYENFNHKYPLRWLPEKPGQICSLEIGCGLGGHIDYEDLRIQDYHAIDIRPDMVERSRKRFPSCSFQLVDCQEGLPYDDGHFDRVIAVHVLEHLPHLPNALGHIHRVLDKDGRFLVVIPCDPGFLYGLAREISTKPLAKKRYNTNFEWLIDTEHINSPIEVMEELADHFEIEHSTYFPAFVPIIPLNLAIGLTLKPLC